MKTTITAKAPTTYQLRSLSAFGIETKKNLDGSFTIEKEFESETAAKEYLKERADAWYHSHDTTQEQLDSMLADIEMYGSLTLDAVTASIEIYRR